LAETFDNLNRYKLKLNPTDEGMTNGPSIFAYLVFQPRRDIIEGILKPMKMTAWRGPGT
jgi:hypothetical protein